MTRKASAFIAGTLALMLLAVWALPDRSVRLANALLRNDGLYALSDTEHGVLSRTLSALLSPQQTFAINAPYDPDQLNVYLVDVPDHPGAAWSHGNAAYAAGADIVFLDAAYLRHGDYRVLETADDALVAKVLAPLRFGAFFALAHELGHRQQASRWLGIAAPARERLADTEALQLLQALYQQRDLHEDGVIADPTSEFASIYSDDLTPLQHMADHLGYAVSFLAADVFEGPFPILSQSDTHPQYLSRLIALLDVVETQAVADADDDAVRSIRQARSAALPAQTLLDWRPTEIVFAHPFQFAYLTDTHLVVLESEGAPVQRIALARLAPGQLLRIDNAAPTGEASVRYAWGSPDGSVTALTRDGRIQRTSVDESDVGVERPVSFGDNTCARRFTPPIGTRTPAYVQYCDNGSPHVAVLTGPDAIETHNLQAVILQATAGARPAGDHARASLASFGLNAAGDPILHASQGAQTLAIRLTPAMAIESVQALHVTSAWLPTPFQQGNARIDRKLFFADADGNSRFVESAGLFRQITVRDATAHDTPRLFGQSSTPQITDPLIRDTAVIRETHSLGGNRMIVNLEQYGAYLIDFAQARIFPLSRDAYTQREQIAVNAEGSWILFRKFGHQIVYFHHKEPSL